jgi:hypothetical protein
LIEVRGSLFVHLARYSYLNVKNALIKVENFVQSVPESVFQQVPPAYRVKEVDAVLKILVAAGLAKIEEGSSQGIVWLLLTERQAAGDMAKDQEIQAVLTHLHAVFDAWNPADLVSRPSSFPTLTTTIKATGVDRAQLLPGDSCTSIEDRPDSNETNADPFLQETIDRGAKPLVLMQFWPLPDPKGNSAGSDPELLLLIPSDLTLRDLVREKCIPVLAEFFQNIDHQSGAAEIQSKYASYMQKYREKFSAAASVVGDRIDKVLTTSDPEGEAFANAVYVVVQVLRTLGRASATPTKSTIVVFQAARIAYAQAMALRVRKRKAEKEAVGRVQDVALLVNRLKESTRPLTLDELKKTTDSSKTREIGSKYASLIELLPLSPVKEGMRPPLYEVHGAFIHRENLIRTFLELKEQEALAQRERLAQQWAAQGIPPVEELFLNDRDVSPDFFKVLETIRQERVLSPTLAEFLRDFLPAERDLTTLAALLWPEGHRGALTPAEVVTRGLDPLLYEDKDRLRHRSLAGVLNLASVYAQIVKNAWNLVFMEEGLFGYLLRRLSALFGGHGESKKKEPAAPKGTSDKKAGKGGTGAGIDPSADLRAQKAADLKKLKTLAPALQDRDGLIKDREKLVAQWCLKLDGEAARKTRQVVDNEVARWAIKIPIEQMAEENAAKVALFLVQKSPTLAEVTSSRAFHRYLYLTALLRCSEFLSR